MASDKVCGFCGLGQNAETVCGKLYSRQLTRVTVAAHKKCMQYSSNLNQSHDDDFGGFDIKDVRKEIRRGKKLFCYGCKLKKKRASVATSGCELRKCRKTFHFYCARQHPQSRTCRRRRRDTGEDIYWVFCSQEHKNEYLKTHAGKNETSCSETDDEDDQASRQHSRAQSRKADKVSGTYEEDESSDPDERDSGDDGVEIASSCDLDQGRSAIQKYDDEDEGQESGNETDVDPDEHDHEKSATQATDSEETRHSFESNKSAQSKGERSHSVDSNASAQSEGEWRHSVDSNMSAQSKGEKRHSVDSNASAQSKGEWRHLVDSNASAQSEGEWRHLVDSNASAQSKGEWRHSVDSNASAQSKGERRHSTDSNESAQSNGEESMPQITVRKRKAVTICEEKGEQPSCSTAKRIRSTAGPLKDRTTPDPSRHPVQSSSDLPRHRVQSLSDPPRHPVQSSSKTTGYQARTHGNGVPGSSEDGLFQGLSPAASVSCGEAGVQHKTEGISGPDSSPDANTCARPGHASALDATAEDPGRLRADQTMTNGGRRLTADQSMTSGGRRLTADQSVTSGGRRLTADQTMTNGDLAATPHHETGLTSFPNMQGQCGTRTLDAEVESELYLQRECLRSEIRRNNIVVEKVQKNMAWLEEKQRRKEEKRDREEKQHAALMVKLHTEIALVEQRKNREEELHGVVMEKLQKELEVCNMTRKKIQEEMALIGERKNREEERRKREEENDKRQEQMYKGYADESSKRQEYYSRAFKL